MISHGFDKEFWENIVHRDILGILQMKKYFAAFWK